MLIDSIGLDYGLNLVLIDLSGLRYLIVILL